MAVSLESRLRAPVAGWLVAEGFEVRHEVPILRRRADVVGWRDDVVAAVEMKLEDWAGGMRQAIAYQLAADWTWVAMPLAAASRAYLHRWRFESECVGLLAVDDAGCVRTPIPAQLSPRLLPFLRDALGSGPLAGSATRPLCSQTRKLA